MKEEDVKPFVEDYLALLENGNYEEIEPISYFYENNIIKGFEELENESGLDFQAGIDIVEYTDFKSKHSHSYYGMPFCELTMKVNVSGTDALMEICVVDNDGTYNVCDIYITINGKLFGIS
jgi:hypothetical protein